MSPSDSEEKVSESERVSFPTHTHTNTYNQIDTLNTHPFGKAGECVRLTFNITTTEQIVRLLSVDEIRVNTILTARAAYRGLLQHVFRNIWCLMLCILLCGGRLCNG